PLSALSSGAATMRRILWMAMALFSHARASPSFLGQAQEQQGGGAATSGGAAMTIDQSSTTVATTASTSQQPQPAMPSQVPPRLMTWAQAQGAASGAETSSGLQRSSALPIDAVGSDGHGSGSASAKWGCRWSRRPDCNRSQLIGHGNQYGTGQRGQFGGLKTSFTKRDENET
ncbi:unnamed protein product, partial [Prorocentrum cordatum]